MKNELKMKSQGRDLGGEGILFGTLPLAVNFCLLRRESEREEKTEREGGGREGREGREGKQNNSNIKNKFWNRNINLMRL